MKFSFKSIFWPKLFDLIINKRYDKKTFMSDLIAGVIVGIIALPLAIAFGIASGVTPQQGLITAIVAGLLTSLFGGSKFLIGGPTGAFIVIVYGIVSQYGISGLIIATVLAGVILVLMGVFKLGNIIKFIPYPIVVGFTSGIALVIFSTQIKDLLGLQISEIPADFIPKWGAYIRNFSTINPYEATLGIFSLLVIVFWPKVNKRIPGSLVAIVLGTVAAILLSKISGVDFATIGSKFPELAGGIPLPRPQAPNINFATIRELFQPAVTIALLCAIESLLAAMVADGVTGKKHDSNTELIGQGITNIVTPFFGGIPSTGAIARTMANINNGGKTPVAGIIHALVLLLIFLFLMPYAVYIPLATLAAILIIVAYNMSEWRTFAYLLKGHRADVAVLVITFLLTVLIDLTVAIEVGVVLAIILFVKRISETSSITVIEQRVSGSESDEAPNEIDLISIPRGVEIYEIDGPFFFGLASKLDEIDRESYHQIKVRIIRMRRVPFIDSTGLNNLRNLWKRSRKERIQIILSGVNSQVFESMSKAGFVNEIGREYIFPHIQLALDKANEIVKKSEDNKRFKPSGNVF
ncbi:MAG: sodium-independent anion transporter [Bacteroidetes bacterium GWE2_39_28]|nr:MAG: sodium-independent anion transporter [Bacteroidetes bacterium GWE2_39_28]OFY15315.1 MAG: sodium-independent anion transporter [Bacteroidetes bacterium GWF2_39_10]OFZ07469.1 MAG: sodium-independent anion transporter [Bacteroidetes bacterium RIFOXYB2_FULL_39_7]OFZ11162.1 MAG: sodium-independent anion transporter [Bacteroidetes bacterium RIFOXYC2_FULL_39_11]HCT93952.1 sodium-independent anion transporter [Rikenellaceae bacterium]